MTNLPEQKQSTQVKLTVCSMTHKTEAVQLLTDVTMNEHESNNRSLLERTPQLKLTSLRFTNLKLELPQLPTSCESCESRAGRTLPSVGPSSFSCYEETVALQGYDEHFPPKMLP
mmetsp:Transcript_49777/g.89391  ORF Transcript_49777/g.89391 Transcript_49777/m.89391 type:complete len:115 (-) Transcript_49777:264-608(-)